MTPRGRKMEDKMKTEKNIINLSKKAERQFRLNKLPNGTYSHSQPRLAGAWVDNNKQYICSGFWAVRYDNITDGTINADTEYNPVQVDSFFPRKKELGTRLEIDLAELKQCYKNARKENKDKQFCKLGEAHFDAELVRDVMATFEKPICYIPTTARFNTLLYIKGDNGDGIVLPMRADFKPKNIIYEVAK